MITIRLARMLLVLLTATVASIVLPYYYWMAFESRSYVPVVGYSPITNDFLFIRTDSGAARYTDTRGNSFSRERFEELLPLMNYRQLAASGKMPDSLRGVKLDMRTVGTNNILMRIEPAAIGAPQIPLYPLIESQSGRVQLEFPAEYFRITDRMEFINAATNTVDEEQSALYSQALLASGFRFPATKIAGNPSTIKPFDEGYFVVDAARSVFHIKKVKGQPWCVKTEIPPTLGIRHLVIQELPLREFYGIIVTDDNRLLLISYDNYRLIPLPVDHYDWKSMMVQFRGDLFFRTITLISEHGVETVVTDRAYTVIARYAEPRLVRDETAAGRVAAALFPFTVDLTDRNDAHVDFFIRPPGFISLLGIGVALIIFLIVARLEGRPLARLWFDVAVVACTGVFGLAGVLLINDPE